MRSLLRRRRLQRSATQILRSIKLDLVSAIYINSALKAWNFLELAFIIIISVICSILASGQHRSGLTSI